MWPPPFGPPRAAVIPGCSRKVETDISLSTVLAQLHLQPMCILRRPFALVDSVACALSVPFSGKPAWSLSPTFGLVAHAHVAPPCLLPGIVAATSVESTAEVRISVAVTWVLIPAGTTLQVLLSGSGRACDRLTYGARMPCLVGVRRGAVRVCTQWCSGVPGSNAGLPYCAVALAHSKKDARRS